MPPDATHLSQQIGRSCKGWIRTKVRGSTQMSESSSHPWNRTHTVHTRRLKSKEKTSLGVGPHGSGGQRGHPHITSAARWSPCPIDRASSGTARMQEQHRTSIWLDRPHYSCEECPATVREGTMGRTAISRGAEGDDEENLGAST